jgi:predicted RecA/RadA family phage recombinase
MPQATFIQEGNAIDFTPAADVAVGDVVVVGDFVGVAKQAIKANALGALTVVGVFDVAKATGVAFTAGQPLYWDDAANVATATATGNKLLGKATRAAANADTTVRVRLSQ